MIILFSEKYNYKAEQAIQIESMSDSLRSRIWNLFYKNEIRARGIHASLDSMNGRVSIVDIVADKLGCVIDDSPSKTLAATIQRKIVSAWSWYEVYDFIEIYLSSLEGNARLEREKQYNLLLEQEKAGYRILNGEITPITNEVELVTVEQATNTEFSTVNEHMQKAVEFYSDLQDPDYENSIKESISAVEALCCIISGKDQTLNKAIADLKNKGVHIHPCLENAFKQLYSYTSDEKGIRHAGIDFVSAPAEDAKFMLISCSAFINYLIEKKSKNVK